MRSNVKPIQYIVGDATRPQGAGQKIIAHVCNDLGRWGKGFVLAVSRRWREPEDVFKASFRANNNCALGDIQIVPVSPEITIVNMIAQHRVAVKSETSIPPIRYEALERALSQVAEGALELNATVHMPRIGCGLAGGRWELIEPIIEKQLSSQNIAVTVYDFA